MEPARNIWDQQPGEPDLWHRRFRLWLENDSLLPRSMLAVYNQERWQKHQENAAAGHEKARKGMERSGKREGSAPEGMISAYTPARCLPTAWHRAKCRYQWKERAVAYDQERFRRDEEEWEQRQEEKRHREVEEALHPERAARERRLQRSLAMLSKADVMLARARAQQAGTKERMRGTKLEKTRVSKRAAKLATEPSSPTPLWNQWPFEPDLWFRRFSRWLTQPPRSRSILSVYKAEQHNPRAHCLSGNWTHAITKWQWRCRAGAYDLDRWRKEITREGAGVSFLTPAERGWKHAIERTGRRGEELLRTVAPILAAGGGR